MVDRIVEIQKTQPVTLISDTDIEQAFFGEGFKTLKASNKDLAFIYNGIDQGQYTTVIWPGVIDLASIDAEVSRIHQLVNGEIFDFYEPHTLKTAHMSLMTADHRLIQGNMRRLRTHWNFQSVAPRPEKNNFIRFDFKNGDRSFSFTASNESGDGQGEFAITQYGKSQVWDSPLVTWMLRHHQDKSLVSNVNSSEVAELIAQTAK